MDVDFVWTNKGPLSEAVAVAVEKVALEIERDTKTMTPVDTGNLRRSYHTSLSMGLNRDTQEARVGTNVYYAPFVEFGTRHGGRAQPHLGPALERARARYGR